MEAQITVYDVLGMGEGALVEGNRYLVSYKTVDRTGMS